MERERNAPWSECAPETKLAMIQAGTSGTNNYTESTKKYTEAQSLNEILNSVGHISELEDPLVQSMLFARVNVGQWREYFGFKHGNSRHNVVLGKIMLERMTLFTARSKYPDYVPQCHKPKPYFEDIPA